jgi:hypothetical protein
MCWTDILDCAIYPYRLILFTLLKHVLSIWKIRFWDQHVPIQQPAPTAPRIEQTQESLPVEHKSLQELNTVELYLNHFLKALSKIFLAGWKPLVEVTCTLHSGIQFLYFKDIPTEFNCKGYLSAPLCGQSFFCLCNDIPMLYVVENDRSVMFKTFCRNALHLLHAHIDLYISI